MTSRYSQWAGPLMDVGRFEWERVIKKCAFQQQSTKLVALLLATYASEDGSSVRPGRERLSIVAGLSPKHVSTQMGKLESLGLIFKIHNGSSYGRRGGLASVYQLTVPIKLHEAFLESNELEQLPHEAAWVVVSQKQENPSSPVSVDNPEEQGNPSSPDRASEGQEQGNSEAEHVNSETEQGNSEAEQVNPSSPHQSFTPNKNHHPKNIKQAASVTLGDAHASENAWLSGELSLEDERNRQSEALQKRIRDFAENASA